MAQSLEPPPTYGAQPVEVFLREIRAWQYRLWAKLTATVADGNAAGGDLSGTYPDPTVGGLGGDALPSNVADGFLARDTGNTAWELKAYGSAIDTVCQGNDSRLSDARTPLAHVTTHENGGADEISVAGLSGLLADGQTPLAHKTSHQNGGADELDLVGMGMVEADGAALAFGTNSDELSGLSGASVTTSGLIPAGAYHIAITTRVLTTITGATSFDIGDGTDVDAWGATIGLTAGTTTDPDDWTVGSSPKAGSGEVTLTANGGNFTDGSVRVVAFYKTLTAPTS